jgi:hypothetical protein
MNNPDIPICETIQSKMNEIIDKINQLDDAIEADPLHSELRILDWVGFEPTTFCLRSKHSYH